LVVAIADVAEYVRPGDPLDRVGLERGNSVYLPDRVVPMLPEALSNDLCSLRPEVHRLALVCDMQVSATGRVSKFRFYEGLIRSWARLTYTQVAGFIAGDREGIGAEIARSLNALHAVFGSLRTEREARGALDFETRELNLVLENGLLERIEPVERNVAHMLIEEAMISANVCAARFLESNERAGLYRVHEGPTGEKFDALRDGLAAAGIRLSNRKPTPKDLMRIIAGLGDRPDRALLEMLILRSMTQAVYTPSNVGHFGLALSRYMHFTSPIRRYADLVVHRAIKSVLRRDGQPDLGRDLGEVGMHISLTERRAEEVGRAVEDWLKCEYAVQWVGQTFSGRVVGVTDFGLFIELEDVFIQGLLHISNLGNDYFHLNGPGTSLVGERSGRHFDMGAELEVVLADVDVEARKIDLLLPGARGRGRDKRRSRR
jgi:ribonuclease R